MAVDTGQKLEILSSQIDEQNEGLYRILDGYHVRYVTILPGTFDEETMCWPHLLLPLLPPFPDGTWTTMEISRQEDGNLRVKTTLDPLEAVECLWHPTYVDVLSLPNGKRLKTNVRETVYQSRPAILKIAHFPWEIHRMEWETWAYSEIESHTSDDESPVAPSVLGHVTEEGRVIGILLEKVEGDHASIADLDLCKSIIQRLHIMGIYHGDPCRHNFVIDRAKGSVRVLDFEHARPLSNLDDVSIEKELSNLSEELREESGRGAAFKSS